MRFNRRNQVSAGNRFLARFLVMTIFASLFASLFYISTERPELASASHGRGWSLNWTKTAANTADFEFSASYRCTYFPGGGNNPCTVKKGDTFTAENIDFGDGTIVTENIIATLVDPANDYIIGTASFSHTYSGAGPFTAFMQSSARLGNPPHVNNPIQDFRVETIVDFSVTGSPQTFLPPIVDCPQNALCSFTVPAVDPAFLPLNYRFSTSAEATGTTGFAQPVGATVDPNTGLYQWNTTNPSPALLAGQPTFYSSQVTVESKVGGVVKSKSPIDFFIRISNDSANMPQFNNPTPADATILSGVIGTPITFNTNATSPANRSIALSMLNAPGGATYNTVSGSPATGAFSWTPSAIGTYIVTLLAQDPTGLGATPRSVLMRVTNPPANVVPTVASASTLVTTAFSQTFSVTVTDTANAPVPSAVVTCSLPTSGASGTFAGGLTSKTVTADASGVATCPAITANSTTGTYNLTYTSGSASGTTSLTNTDIGSLTAPGTTNSTQVTTVFNPSPSVTVTDSSNNPLSGVTVTFTAPNGAVSGSFAGGALTATAVTNASGVATMPTFTANTKAGTYNVVASLGSKTANLVMQNTPGTASVIVPPASPASTAITTAFSPSPAVTVNDANGNPVSGIVVTFTAPGSGQSGSFAGPSLTATATTNASGVATMPTFTANGTVGSYSVAASIPGGISANVPMTNTVGTAASLTANPTTDTTVVNTAFASTFTATVKDASNNPVPGASVTFTLPPSGASGTFAGGVKTVTVTANGSGVATAPAITANTTAGTYNMTITSGAASGTVALTNTAGAATAINASATPTNVQVNNQPGTPPVVTVVDQYGNPVANKVVTFTAPNSGASGTFGANGPLTITGTTDAAGKVTLPGFIANAIAGAYNIVASITTGGISTTVNVPMNNTAGSAGSITVSPTTDTTVVNTAFTSTFTATVKDSNNNPVPGASVTFTLPASGASGTFAGGLTSKTVTADASGVATAPAITANTTAGTYNMTITSGAASGTVALTNTAGAPGSITGSSTASSAPITTVFTNKPVVTVKDGSGNLAIGVVVTFTAPATGPSGTFAGGAKTATATTDANGQATMPTFTANINVGSYNVVASVPGGATFNVPMTNTGSGSQQGLLYYPLPKPIRVLDTRPAGAALNVGPGAIAGGTARNLVIGNQTYQGVKIPAAAKAVEATTTIAEPASSGFLTVYPGPNGTTMPLAATMNYNSGQPYLTNSANMTLGNDGSVNIYASASVNVVLDIYGYYAPLGTPDPNNGNRTDTGLLYYPLSKPVRAIDTRGDPAFYNTKASVKKGSSVNFMMAGMTIGGTTIPAGAKALTGNTQVAVPSGAGYLTLYPGPADPTAANWPVASNVVFNGGEYLSNSLIMNLGTDGTMNIFAFTTTDVVVDITGYYLPYTANVAGGLMYYPLPAQMRVMDTRGGTAYTNGGGTVVDGTSRNLAMTGVTYQSVSIPGNAKVVEGSMGAKSANTGFITIYPGPTDPTGANRTVSTSLIFQASRYLSNSSKMMLGSDGSINIYTFQTVDLVLDVTGYFA